jgi:hypothetical protein
MMYTVVSKQPGLGHTLEALRFPIAFERSEEFGSLPLTYIVPPISTIRLPDEVIIQSTEISGMDAVEEVVNVSDIGKLSDPLKDKLTGLLKAHGLER